MPEGIGYGPKAMKMMRIDAVKVALDKKKGKKAKKKGKKDEEPKKESSADE